MRWQTNAGPINASLANDLRPQGRTDIPTVRGAAMFLERFVNALMDAPGARILGGSLDREETYLHPTKGWRGSDTRPRGTNRRRVKCV